MTLSQSASVPRHTFAHSGDPWCSSIYLGDPQDHAHIQVHAKRTHGALNIAVLMVKIYYSERIQDPQENKTQAESVKPLHRLSTLPPSSEEVGE